MTYEVKQVKYIVKVNTGISDKYFPLDNIVLVEEITYGKSVITLICGIKVQVDRSANDIVKILYLNHKVIGKYLLEI